jgi:hypothetical protein
MMGGYVATSGSERFSLRNGSEICDDSKELSRRYDKN